MDSDTQLNDSNERHRFAGRTVVLATMHGKERVIAPLLEKHLDVKVIVPDNFNTDTFGTFTRDIERTGTQLDAARAKAHAAMDSVGADIGVASEGSFGTHPSSAFLPSNLELLLLVDKKNGYEIRGHHRTGLTNMSGAYVQSVEEALAFANRVGFPSHGVIVRRNEHSASDIHKDIHTESDLKRIVSNMLSGFFSKSVYIETDMRAHRNPTRMNAIQKATEDLVKNAASRCPACGAPGFCVVDTEKGLPCSACGMPTELPCVDIYRCAACTYTDTKPVRAYGPHADPAYCGSCNP